MYILNDILLLDFVYHFYLWLPFERRLSIVVEPEGYPSLIFYFLFIYSYASKSQTLKKKKNYSNT